MRHDAVRNTTAELLREVCSDVQIEPSLLPVSGEDLPSGSNIKNDTRSDVSVRSIWAPLSRTFFDIRVFNPLAQTNWEKEIPDMYRFHESRKKEEYNARILEIEKGTFTPLVFSCFGGAAPEAEKFIKMLAMKISEKRAVPYSQMASFIRRKIRFDILRVCTIALRGERGKGMRDFEEMSNKDVELVNLSQE